MEFRLKELIRVVCNRSYALIVDQQISPKFNNETLCMELGCRVITVSLSLK